MRGSGFEISGSRFRVEASSRFRGVGTLGWQFRGFRVLGFRFRECRFPSFRGLPFRVKGRILEAMGYRWDLRCFGLKVRLFRFRVKRFRV